MGLLKKWWFWAILIIVLIVIIFIFLYIDGKDGEIGEDKCTSQGCAPCGESCIPMEVAIAASCPVSSEEFECECVNERCVKK